MRAPTLAEYVPRGHSEHDDAFDANAYDPGAHKEHVPEPAAAAYDPGEHTLHTLLERAPTSAENDPRGHSEHDDDPSDDV